MVTNEIITTILSVYGAGLSTLLAYNQFQRRKPQLKFSCSFSKVNKKHTMVIVVHNMSDLPITIVEASFPLGESRASVNFMPTKSSIEIGAHSSHQFYLPLKPDIYGFLQVNEFNFKSSRNKVFKYRLLGSIFDELQMHVVTEVWPKRLYEFELLDRQFNENLSQIEEASAEIETLMSKFDEQSKAN
ncbi:hypothetical protein P3489_23135 [Vibrio parahaemolyticus]|nr:hypothetical protein [Vibrio parahaemolyticus]